MKKGHPESKGFSLAEVCLALGVAAFCLVSVLGLLPVGLTSNSNSVQQTTAAGLMAAVIGDLQGTPAGVERTPIFKIEIPASGGVSDSPQHLYFDEGGGMDPAATETQPAPYNPAKSVFRVSVAFSPPAAGSKTATQVRLLLTWPAIAGGACPTGRWPTQYSGALETIVSLNRN